MASAKQEASPANSSSVGMKPASSPPTSSGSSTSTLWPRAVTVAA
jgi:hypothetical protein